MPSTITVGAWLSLTHFSGSETGDGKNLSAIWDVNLYPLPGGGLAAQLYDYVNQVTCGRPSPFLSRLIPGCSSRCTCRKPTGPTGEVTVWQDGVQILQRSNVATVSNDWVQWDAGGACRRHTLPSPAYVYMDDAAISLVRLGPGS